MNKTTYPNNLDRLPKETVWLDFIQDPDVSTSKKMNYAQQFLDANASTLNSLESPSQGLPPGVGLYQFAWVIIGTIVIGTSLLGFTFRGNIVEYMTKVRKNFQINLIRKSTAMVEEELEPNFESMEAYIAERDQPPRAGGILGVIDVVTSHAFGLASSVGTGLMGINQFFEHPLRFMVNMMQQVIKALLDGDNRLADQFLVGAGLMSIYHRTILNPNPLLIVAVCVRAFVLITGMILRYFRKHFLSTNLAFRQLPAAISVLFFQKLRVTFISEDDLENLKRHNTTVEGMLKTEELSKKTMRLLTQRSMKFTHKDLTEWRVLLLPNKNQPTPGNPLRVQHNPVGNSAHSSDDSSEDDKSENGSGDESANDGDQKYQDETTLSRETSTESAPHANATQEMIEQNFKYFELSEKIEPQDLEAARKKLDKLEKQIDEFRKKVDQAKRGMNVGSYFFSPSEDMKNKKIQEIIPIVEELNDTDLKHLLCRIYSLVIPTLLALKHEMKNPENDPSQSLSLVENTPKEQLISHNPFLVFTIAPPLLNLRNPPNVVESEQQKELKELWKRFEHISHFGISLKKKFDDLLGQLGIQEEQTPVSQSGQESKESNSSRRKRRSASSSRLTQRSVSHSNLPKDVYEAVYQQLIDISSSFELPQPRGQVHSRDSSYPRDSPPYPFETISALLRTDFIKTVVKMCPKRLSHYANYKFA